MHYTPGISKFFIIILCSTPLWEACSNIKPVEQVPTYIHIDSFHFDANDKLLNAPVSSQITNISVFYNNNPIGNFDLPATFPVMATGNGSIEIFPGINVDGLNDLTSAYPFYQIDTFGFAAHPGKIANHIPVTSFYNAAKPYLISDFSGNTNFVLYSGNINMVKDSGAGMIQLNTIGDSSIDISAPFSIPSGIAYVEFDYKNTMPFSVGMQSESGNTIIAKQFMSGVNPSGYWQKFYLNVSDFTGQYKGDSYNFCIRAALDSNQNSGRVLIDNICLVTF